MDLENGKIQRDGHESLFAAGQQRNRFQRLARGLDLDLDAAVQDILLILQFQRGFAAAEQFQERLLEAFVDDGELLPENALHFTGDAVDHALQLFLGLFHVVALAGQIFIAGIDPVKFLDGADVRRAEAADLPAQLSDAAIRLGQALQFHALGPGVLIRQLVVVPQAVQDLLFLHGGGGPLLFQASGLPLQLQNSVVLFAALPVFGRALRFQFQLFAGQVLQPGAQRSALGLEFSDLALFFGDLPAQPFRFPGTLLPPRFPLAAVAHHAGAQLFQFLQRMHGGVALRRQAGRLLLARADLLRQRTGLGLQIRLAAQPLPGTFAQLRRLRLQRGDVLLRLGAGRLVFLPAAVQRGQFPGKVFQIGGDAFQQDTVVALLGLQFQNSVFRLALLALGHFQLVLGSRQLPLAGLLDPGGLQQSLLQTAQLSAQAFQLVGPGQDAGAAADAAAGHGAAAVHDLAVQRDDAEARAEFPGHGDAAVQVLHHHGAAQQIFENPVVLRVILHQRAGNADEAALALNALAQLLAAHGRQGQERGPAGVALFQVGDGRLGVLLLPDDDVLHPGAQGHFDGNGEAVLHMDQAGHRAADAAQRVLLRRLHHGAHRLGKALVFLFHLAQQADAGFHGVALHGQLQCLVRRGFRFLPAAFHAHVVAVDHIGDAFALFPGLFQGRAALPGAALRFLPAGGNGGLFLQQRRAALLDILQVRPAGRKFRADVRRPGDAQRLFRPQGLRLVGNAARPAADLLRLAQQVFQFPGQSCAGSVDLLDPGALGVHLFLQILRAGALFVQFVFNAGHISLVVGDPVFHDRDLGLPLADLPVQGGNAAAQLLRLLVCSSQLFAELLRIAVQRLQRLVGRRQFPLGRFKIGLQPQRARVQLGKLMDPKGHFQAAQFVAQDQIAFGRFRLGAQGFHLQLQLGDFVIDTQEVFLGALELALAVLLAVAVFGNAGSFFKHAPPVAALGAEQFVDPALADDGIALVAHAGVHEQLVHIPQADGLLVDIILAFPAAVIAAGDGDFALLHRENMAGVVDHQRNLGKADLGALFRSAENHVLHFAAAQGAAALFAHDPADGVGNIGLAAAVGTDNGGDILSKIQYGLIRKGLEALDFQCFQIHSFLSPHRAGPAAQSAACHFADNLTSIVYQYDPLFSRKKSRIAAIFLSASPQQKSA